MEGKAGSAPPPLTRAERYAAGKALRRTVPWPAQASWQPAPGRADPVAILQAQGTTRIAELLPVRYARMRVSALAFLRGSAAVMAADLAGTPATGLRVQSCGDCHLANFGTYATPEGLPVFDVNDFDETLPAPFEWDAKRLAASLVVSGRVNGLSAPECRGLAVAAMQGYAEEIGRLAALPPLEAWGARIDLRAAIEAIGNPRARRRARANFTERMRSAQGQYGLLQTAGMPRLRDKPPLVMRLPHHDAVTRHAFTRYAATLSPERRMLLDRYRLQDVVFKVVGVGSVGTFCAIGLFATADGEPLLLQIKEAQPSVLEPFAGPSTFHNAGERVVTGQRIMQAASDLFLGWTHAATEPRAAEAGDKTGRQFYVRRLKDDRLAGLGLAIEVHGLTAYAGLCGRTLGRAHARSADLARLAGYLGRGRAFAEAIAAFATAYADQTERDWQAFTAAITAGRIVAG